jgi:hypothetical protein
LLAVTYQLVLQFPGDTLSDLDAMVALEDALIEDLVDSADVDGHDFGSGETNIFIFTDNPEATFATAKRRLQREGRLDSVTAAYRPVDGERYTVIWPKDFTKQFTII